MVYDSDRAVVLASDEYWDGNSWDRNGRNTYLYKTPNGRFFTYGTVALQKGGTLNSLEPSEARELYGELPDQVVPYEKAFGVVPEEA